MHSSFAHKFWCVFESLYSKRISSRRVYLSKTSGEALEVQERLGRSHVSSFCVCACVCVSLIGHALCEQVRPSLLSTMMDTRQGDYDQREEGDLPFPREVRFREGGDV